MMVGGRILKRASASRSSGEWSDDNYDVLADGVVVGRIMKAAGRDGSVRAARMPRRSPPSILPRHRPRRRRRAEQFGSGEEPLTR
jgi:hypothetical protein